MENLVSDKENATFTVHCVFRSRTLGVKRNGCCVARVQLREGRRLKRWVWLKGQRCSVVGWCAYSTCCDAVESWKLFTKKNPYMRAFLVSLAHQIEMSIPSVNGIFIRLFAFIYYLVIS